MPRTLKRTLKMVGRSEGDVKSRFVRAVWQIAGRSNRFPWKVTEKLGFRVLECIKAHGSPPIFIHLLLLSIMPAPQPTCVQFSAASSKALQPTSIFSSSILSPRAWATSFGMHIVIPHILYSFLCSTIFYTLCPR